MGKETINEIIEFWTVEHGPPDTFFDSAKDPRTKEFLSQIL